ncbi:hypothetical protein BDB00DRAFT_81438 [Zychaea mexicana]|uniref:uncharacterized protein n=1 Tax=Zychaea mexicana TaxID=64656 RepID=UPI0022FEE776|nr:uncharacterized protein BDB00DRAFT_81438 [Zychaea mexicana]KAI9487994.1 hypothetical protein BDB00DRAFT_81438 [Zychaea mexicana]
MLFKRSSLSSGVLTGAGEYMSLFFYHRPTTRGSATMFSRLQNLFQSLVPGVKNKSATHSTTTVDPDNNDFPRTMASAPPIQVQKPSQTFGIATTAATNGDSKRGVKRTRAELYESIKSEESEGGDENVSAGQSIASRLRSRRKLDNNADVIHKQATRSSEASDKEGNQGEEEHSDTDTTRCCCPYKSCTYSPIWLCRVYRHIRQKHDAEFPLMKANESYNRVLKNIDGKRILFNAASRNLLDAGEKIVIEYPISETPRYYCPYKSCTSSSTVVRYIHWHIQKKHDGDLPLLKRNGSDTRVFKNKDGKRISFDVASKDLLKTGEKIQICYTDRLPQS